MKALFYLTLFILASGHCTQSNDAYQESIVEWQKQRLENLIKEDGWATLAGLFPLRQGTQYFGGDSGLSIQYPEFAPDTIGSFRVSGDSVWMTTNNSVMVNGVSGHLFLLNPVDSLQLCTLDRLQWFIIKRGERFLVRLRDTQHPARKNLTHIPYYPIDRHWRFSATFHLFDSPKVLALPNALDMTINYECPGYLTFEYQGKEYQMLALEEGEELFLLFYDQTSGTETYGGGRYMYVDKPKPGETTLLDFNKAYSPPCAFTEFATCLLPPQENRFPFTITAGEKDPHFLKH